MGDKKIYIVAKIFDQQGCIAYRCKTLNEARCVPGTLEALRADGVQIVILDSPEIYSEYAPYTYIEDLKECSTENSARKCGVFTYLLAFSLKKVRKTGFIKKSVFLCNRRHFRDAAGRFYELV